MITDISGFLQEIILGNEKEVENYKTQMHNAWADLKNYFSKTTTTSSENDKQAGVDLAQQNLDRAQQIIKEFISKTTNPSSISPPPASVTTPPLQNLAKKTQVSTQEKLKEQVMDELLVELKNEQTKLERLQSQIKNTPLEIDRQDKIIQEQKDWIEPSKEIITNSKKQLAKITKNIKSRDQIIKKQIVEIDNLKNKISSSQQTANNIDNLQELNVRLDDNKGSLERLKFYEDALQSIKIKRDNLIQERSMQQEKLQSNETELLKHEQIQKSAQDNKSNLLKQLPEDKTQLKKCVQRIDLLSKDISNKSNDSSEKSFVKILIGKQQKYTRGNAARG